MVFKDKDSVGRRVLGQKRAKQYQKATQELLSISGDFVDSFRGRIFVPFLWKRWVIFPLVIMNDLKRLMLISVINKFKQ